MEASNKTIWTIGHSTRSWEEFVHLLHSFEICQLVDIRSYPGSRKFPHYNKELMEVSLPKENIAYAHLRSLGGRRPPKKNSVNIAWRHPAFRGYADYMDTQSFKEGIEELEALALQRATAYMCSEAVWWRCHRALVSDYLKVRGWKVMHIMSVGVADEHPFTKPAHVADGKLTYQESQATLFNKLS